MFDYGNPLAGENSEFYTKKANFIEWQPESRPDIAFFANQFVSYAPIEKQVPLNSKDSRVIALKWGPKVLQPGKSFAFTITVGMADSDPITGMPVKPNTHLY
jgi:hypothetical protein